MKKLNIIWSLFVVSVLSFTPLASAQTQPGSITGSVKDEQGAAVPGSDVTVQSFDATFRQTTGDDGAFRFLNLEPGRYRLKATLSGFRAGEREVIVAVGKNVDVTIELHLAPHVESVTVTAPAPML